MPGSAEQPPRAGGVGFRRQGAVWWLPINGAGRRFARVGVRTPGSGRSARLL